MAARVFAFGCSMTAYVWPTWADIVIHMVGGYAENWGISGSGNVGILHRFIEADLRHNFTEDDLILIMWSTPFREDRYLNNAWTRAGNVYTQHFYDRSFMDKYWDDKGAIIKSFNAIAGVNRMLTSRNIQVALGPSNLLDGYTEYDSGQFAPLFEFYRPVLAPVKADLLTFFGGEWLKEKVWANRNVDYHPLPLKHLAFVEAHVAPHLGIEVTDETREWVRDWHNLAVTAQSQKETRWIGYPPSLEF